MKFIDSLIDSYHQNPATILSHSIAHYSCVGQPNGSGGSCDLYQDSSKKIIYLLRTNDGCDNVNTFKRFYFKNNRIVLVAIATVIDEQKQEKK